MCKGKQLRQSLYQMLTQAEVDFEMWQAMRRARRNHSFNRQINQRYSRFYIAAENSLLNSLIMILYKVLEQRNDTVNLNQYEKLLSGDMPLSMKGQVQGLLRAIQSTKKKICILRNNVIGHQSMKLNTEDAYEKVDLWVAEIEQLIENIQQVVFLIAKETQDVHLDFNIKGTKDFDSLVRDLGFAESK